MANAYHAVRSGRLEALLTIALRPGNARAFRERAAAIGLPLADVARVLSDLPPDHPVFSYVLTGKPGQRAARWALEGYRAEEATRMLAPLNDTRHDAVAAAL